MNSKNCSKCGTQVAADASFCINCGSSEFNTMTPQSYSQPMGSMQPPKGGMPTWAKVLIIIGAILLAIGGCTVGCAMYVGKKVTDGLKEAGSFVGDMVGENGEQITGEIIEGAGSIIGEIGEQIKEELEKNTTSQSLGDTFTFSDLEIVLGSNVEVISSITEAEKFIVKVPVTVKNNRSVNNRINSTLCSIYYAGTKLDSAGLAFEDSIDKADYLAPAESYSKYFYLPYVNDGTYKIQITDLINTINIEFNVTK